MDEVPVLRALLEISQAVQRAQYFDEALEVIAEQALLALDAASLSISRWERPDNVLRTLVNVGDLGPGEERWPENQLYPVTDDQHVVELLQHGRPYISSIDDENVDPAAVAVLRRVNKESELAVAVMFDDTMWASCGPPVRAGAVLDSMTFSCCRPLPPMWRSLSDVPNCSAWSGGMPSKIP